MPKPNEEIVTAVALPAEQMAELLEKVGRLVDRLDQEPSDDGTRTQLMAILAEHGKALKSALAPENRLHHEQCYYHPEGRAVDRPKLRRELFFLGVPNDPANMHDDEINAANQITDSLEIASKRWVARILKDAGGKEIIYVSVPFQGFDDLRGLGGGLLHILNTIVAQGIRPLSNDVLMDRLARAESLIAELQASRSATDAPAITA